eukprot:Clim_evm44s242 gene=Clim_evmTU44s242
MTEYEKVPTEEPTEEFEAPPTYGEVEKSSHTEETKSMLRDIEIESVEIQPEVEDHFFKSLFATIACCMPFGLLGLYYNHRSQNAQLKGDYHRAHSYSRVARAFAITSILLGTAGLMAYMTCMAVGIPPHHACPWPVEDPATPCYNLYCRLSPASEKCHDVVREFCHERHEDDVCRRLREGKMPFPGHHHRHHHHHHGPPCGPPPPPPPPPPGGEHPPPPPPPGGEHPPPPPPPCFEPQPAIIPLPLVPMQPVDINVDSGMDGAALKSQISSARPLTPEEIQSLNAVIPGVLPIEAPADLPQVVIDPVPEDMTIQIDLCPFDKENPNSPCNLPECQESLAERKCRKAIRKYCTKGDGANGGDQTCEDHKALKKALKNLRKHIKDDVQFCDYGVPDEQNPCNTDECKKDMKSLQCQYQKVNFCLQNKDNEGCKHEKEDLDEAAKPVLKQLKHTLKNTFKGLKDKISESF